MPRTKQGVTIGAFRHKCPDCPRKYRYLIYLIHHVMGEHGWRVDQAESLIVSHVDATEKAINYTPDSPDHEDFK